MRYYNNAEFTEELLKNLYQKQQKKRFREGLSFAHIAANLRTPAAGCALKNYLIVHPQEKDEVERIFYYNMELDYRWLKVLADSGININTGLVVRMLYWGGRGLLHMSQLFQIFYLWVRISIAQIKMVMML